MQAGVETENQATTKDVQERLLSALLVVGTSGQPDIFKNTQNLAGLVVQEGMHLLSEPLVSSTATELTAGWSEVGLPGGNGKIFAALDMYHISYRKPVVVASIPTILAASEHELQGDAVRTGSVLSQWIDHKFDSRQRDVFIRAIAREGKWLELHGIPHFRDDPRATPRETLLETVMGAQRYLLDCGFKDWQKAVDLMVEFGSLNIRDNLFKELDQVRLADQEGQADPTTLAGVKNLVDTLSEVVKEASERVKDQSILGVVRGNKGFFTFIREDAVSRWSMRAELQAVNMLDPLRTAKGVRTRALGSAFYLAAAVIGEVEAGRARRKQDFSLVDEVV